MVEVKMHEFYNDIRERINEEPKWYDENGCPRYRDFHPNLCPDIYARIVVLMRIACQECGEEMDVEVSGGYFHPIRSVKKLHYGDPPGHGCLGAGETMNCEDLAILQVWTKNANHDWERITAEEGPID